VAGHRPTIRKILNRDVAANRMMILAVSQVLAPARPSKKNIEKAKSTCCAPHAKVVLTDGWYFIQAAFDAKLAEFVQNDIIRVGTKLLVSNAQLVGAEDGIDPLDEEYNPTDPSCKVGLMLTANSTRLAKWDAKLGFVKTRVDQAPKGLLRVKRISDIIPGGGNIPLLRLVVLRRYPLLFYEKRHTTEQDGQVRNPVLTEAEEDQRRMEFEKRMLKAVEKLTESLERELEKVSKRCDSLKI
jgi:hypothetical protein